MKHVGILAHSTEGAALCFLASCQEGERAMPGWRGGPAGG